MARQASAGRGRLAKRVADFVEKPYQLAQLAAALSRAKSGQG